MPEWVAIPLGILLWCGVGVLAMGAIGALSLMLTALRSRSKPIEIQGPEEQ